MKIFGIDINKPPAEHWCIMCCSDAEVTVEGSDKKEYFLCQKCFVNNNEADLNNYIRKNNFVY